MEWETVIALIFLTIFFVLTIIQSIRAFLWKDRCLTLSKASRFGVKNGEESSSGREAQEKGNS